MHLESVVGGQDNISLILSSSSYSEHVSPVGTPVTLRPIGMQPWPLIVTLGGYVKEWTASFGTTRSDIAPGATATLKAELLYAPPRVASPERIDIISLVPISTISLGEILYDEDGLSYSGSGTVNLPFEKGGYFLARFAIDSIDVANVEGFEAQASIALA